MIDGNAGVLVFGIGETGDVDPLRQIIGNTSLASGCQGGAYNPTTDEIFVACEGTGILVFNRTDDGDVMAKRMIPIAGTINQLGDAHDVALAR